MAAALIAGIVIPPISPGQCSQPTAYVSTNGIVTSCGTTTWQSGYTFNGTNHPFNDYSPTGNCGGGNYLCNCSYNSSYYNTGSLTGNVVPGGGGWEVIIVATNQQPIERTSCTQWDPCCTAANDYKPDPNMDTIYDWVVTC